MSPARPPSWSEEQLESDRTLAIEDFRRERMKEPLEVYLDAFNAATNAMETLLEATIDLTRLQSMAPEILRP
jgi:hypothetical protein